MIKNIVFDNGGVLVRYCKDTYLNYFKFSTEEKNLLSTLFQSSEWTMFLKGMIDREKFVESCILKMPQLEQEIIKINAPENLKFIIPIYKKTLKFIEKVKKNYKVFLLSDINEDTISYLKENIENFEALFDGIVYSCRVGLVKKEEKGFEFLLKTFDLKSEETLFLDDSQKNLDIANKFGIQTFKFTNPSKDIKKVKCLLKKSK